MALTTITPSPEGAREPRWLTEVPTPAVTAGAAAAVGACSMLFAYLLAGGLGGQLEVAIAVLAVAALFLAPARLSSYVSVGSIAVFCLVELGADRYDGGVGWREIARPLALAGVLLAASTLRLSIRRRDAELAVAAEAIRELTERDSIVARLAGPYEPTWLEAELARSQRHNHHVALVLLRPDRFSELAALGGDVGQEVLEAVAEVVGSELRSIDVALRHGPATFALILPETPVEGARVAAERIRLSLPSRVRGVGGLPVSVSLGIATFPEDATTTDELVAAAEHALDRAVEYGGNRTLCASAPATAPSGWTAAGARPR